MYVRNYNGMAHSSLKLEKMDKCKASRSVDGDIWADNEVMKKSGARITQHLFISHHIIITYSNKDLFPHENEIKSWG